MASLSAGRLAEKFSIIASLRVQSIRLTNQSQRMTTPVGSPPAWSSAVVLKDALKTSQAVSGDYSDFSTL